MTAIFKTEADLVSAFCEVNRAEFRRHGYTPYNETANWDLLLVHKDGHQIGIEAKLKLNAKVLSQALPQYRWHQDHGPDFRAVLVPQDGLQHYMAELAWHLGINVISHGRRSYLDVPGGYGGMEKWHPWLPSSRPNLPEYVPDVIGGHSAPVQLTEWKIKAMKIVILARRRPVHKADFNHIKISSQRWVAAQWGYLLRTPEGFVCCDRTPDLSREHPTVWAQIEADFDKWAPPERPGLLTPHPALFATEAAA